MTNDSEPDTKGVLEQKAQQAFDFLYRYGYQFAFSVFGAGVIERSKPKLDGGKIATGSDLVRNIDERIRQLAEFDPTNIIVGTTPPHYFAYLFALTVGATKIFLEKNDNLDQEQVLEQRQNRPTSREPDDIESQEFPFNVDVRAWNENLEILKARDRAKPNNAEPIERKLSLN